MTKKFRIITLIAAIAFGLGGVAFGIYGLAMLTKTIKTNVSYEPPVAIVSAKYYHYTGEPGSPDTKKKEADITFTGNTAEANSVVLEGVGDFIVYEINMANKYSIYDIRYDIEIKITHQESGKQDADDETMEVYVCDDEEGAGYENSDNNLWEYLESQKYSYYNVIAGGGAEKLFILIKASDKPGSETKSGNKKIEIIIDFSEDEGEES